MTRSGTSDKRTTASRQKRPLNEKKVTADRLVTVQVQVFPTDQRNP
jgi:hypothetical protein